jgi:hypothetical protein
LDSAIAYHFDVPPEGTERPKLFHFFNMEGVSAMEVVATSATVQVRPDPGASGGRDAE